MRRFAHQERGNTVVELLVATLLGLGLAGVLGHSIIAYQTGYHRAAARINSHQQAQRVLALMADEVTSAQKTVAAANCPAAGIRLTAGRLEFWGNLYDRSTMLQETAPLGASEIVVASRDAFESGDSVKVVNVGDPVDPSDDASECLRIADIRAGRWTLEQPLTQVFQAGSPVTLVNHVAYALDRYGRLMRTQDGGTQRIAQDVEGFGVEVDSTLLVLRLTMNGVGEWTRRVSVEAD